MLCRQNIVTQLSHHIVSFDNQGMHINIYHILKNMYTKDVAVSRPYNCHKYLQKYLAQFTENRLKSAAAADPTIDECNVVQAARPVKKNSLFQDRGQLTCSLNQYLGSPQNVGQ